MFNKMDYQNYEINLFGKSRIINRQRHGITETNSMKIIKREEDSF
jgi:hypothetical protein